MLNQMESQIQQILNQINCKEQAQKEAPAMLNQMSNQLQQVLRQMETEIQANTMSNPLQTKSNLKGKIQQF